MHLSMYVPQRQLYILILSNSLFCQGDFGFGSSEGKKILNQSSPGF